MALFNFVDILPLSLLGAANADISFIFALLAAVNMILKDNYHLLEHDLGITLPELADLV